MYYSLVTDGEEVSIVVVVVEEVVMLGEEGVVEEEIEEEVEEMREEEEMREKEMEEMREDKEEEEMREEEEMKEEEMVDDTEEEKGMTEVLDVISDTEGDEERDKSEEDTIVEMLLIIIIGDEEEKEEKKEVADEIVSIGDVDIEDTMEVEGINEDEKKLSIEDTSLLLGTGVVTVVVTIGISIELFDTVINDEVLKPFLMEKIKHYTKHHDNKKRIKPINIIKAQSNINCY